MALENEREITKPFWKARRKMKNKIRWLRISYWAGAIGDFTLAILALVPGTMEVPSYYYPMGLLSAVAFSWGCMLIWADREPLERRWVLKPTILVGSLLLIAVIYSMYSGAIGFGSHVHNLVLYPAMIVLWSFSYRNARDIE
jgi:hypothetical protein